MALRKSTAARNASANAVVDLLDAALTPGLLRIYTADQAATVAANPSGTLLAALTFSPTAFGDAVAGVATANAIISDTDCAASGTAGHFTASDGDGNVIFDGDVTDDMAFDIVNVTQHGTVNCAAFSYQDPIQ